MTDVCPGVDEPQIQISIIQMLIMMLTVDLDVVPGCHMMAAHREGAEDKVHCTTVHVTSSSTLFPKNSGWYY